MRRKTLGIVLDAFIVLLIVTIIMLIMMIIKRGEAPMVANETQMEQQPIVQSEPTVTEEAPDEPVEEQKEEVAKDLLARCNAEGVNVRAGAGTNHNVLGLAADGDEYKVIANHSNGWTELEYKGSIGFIFTEYLDFYYMSGGEYTPVERSEIPWAED